MNYAGIGMHITVWGEREIEKEVNVMKINYKCQKFNLFYIEHNVS